MMDSARSSLSSSPVEERRLIDSWEPEPLVPDIDATRNKHFLNPHIITSKSGKYITIDNVKCLNMCTNNYLGLADHSALESSAIEAVRRYGVGSCGPRAFYGTMDVHLKLEEELARFLQVQEAVLYSFGFSTIASAIPAYAKASDIIFVDEEANFAIQQGMVASRSRVIKFKHNDMDHLRQLIEDMQGEQLRKRTFIIVEGIYAKTGDICPLDELVELKKRYKIRLFIDESRSFGVLGSDGKGVTQHFNVDINDVDLIMASLENALCAYGGFCAGSTFIVDHQRLAGAGYCFSASLPPFQTRVALESLSLICKNPTIVRDSQELYKYAHDVFKKLSGMKNISHELSPIKLLILKDDRGLDAQMVLTKICSQVMADERIAISVSRFMEEEEMTCPVASIRVVISGCLVRQDIDRVCLAINAASRMVV